MSTELEKHGIDFYAGWHPENIGKPDVIMIGGGGTSPSNPEIIYANENHIPVYSYAEVIGKFFVKEFSIVATGTWGKTSSSAILSFILQKAGFDPTYMFGGISLSHSASAKLTDSRYSVFEGDEYQASISDKKPKFFYYKPTHLLLSAVSWDHADLYPTEESYFKVFRDLISKTKFIIANGDNAKIRELVKNAIWYGKENADYIYRNIKQSANGLHFEIEHSGKCYEIFSPMIGAFQAENITGCFAMTFELGINPDDIISAIKEFKGLKRRLEKRLNGETSADSITVFDDIAHSPEKAYSVLENLRKIYKGKIITVFEPNIGARERATEKKYDNAFKNSDIVIIPRLTKLKIAEEDSKKPIDGAELAAIISKTHPDVKYIEDDNNLVNFLESETKKGDIIAFLGSHGFRNMIEETITSLRRLSL